jgi:hypothetical protein
MAPRAAYMSSTGPNRPWWSCAAFTRLAACGCPWHAPDAGEGPSGIAPYAAADIRGGSVTSPSPCQLSESVKSPAEIPSLLVSSSKAIPLPAGRQG